MTFVMTNFTPSDMPNAKKAKAKPVVATPKAQEKPLTDAQTASESPKAASTGKTTGSKKK